MLPQNVKDTFKKHNYRPIKKWGQHFLFDRGILNRLAQTARLTPHDTVLEIGPGVGSLTSILATKCQKVVAIEVDRRLCHIAKELLSPYPNVEVVEGDILKIDLDKLDLGMSYKVVANLPYYITTPIIMKLLKERERIEDMALTVQQEVAKRISAQPGGKDYGSLSLAIQFYCNAEISFSIPSSFFYPRPEVDSAVVHLRVRENPVVEVEDEEVFFRVVKASFTQRRKTLLNSLSAELGLGRERVKTLLKDAEITPTRRGETLSAYEFARIASLL